MKYLLVIVATIMFNVSADENQVVFGKTKHTGGHTQSNQSFVDELTLKNCDVKLSTFESDSTTKIRISSSDRVFVADAIFFTLSYNG